MRSRCLAILVLAVALNPARASEELFAQRVAPLLSRSCLGCHDSAMKRGGLDLSTAKSALAGGDDGPVIAPGSGARSKLVQFVSGAKPRMPRGGPKLTDAEVALLKRWIDEGAKWPA